MARAANVALLVAVLLLAGCTEPYEKQGGPGEEEVPPCTPGVGGCPCPEDSQPAEGGCAPIDTVLLDLQFAGSGNYEVGVPFPHGAWCLTAEDWLAGMKETANVSHHEARDVDRGKVLWFQARDDAKFLAAVEVTDRATCDSPDAWSTDPDPARETVDVTSQQGIEVTIYLRNAQGGCAELRQFQGPVSGGWTSVPQRFNGTACT